MEKHSGLENKFESMVINAELAEMQRNAGRGTHGTGNNPSQQGPQGNPFVMCWSGMNAQCELPPGTPGGVPPGLLAAAPHGFQALRTHWPLNQGPNAWREHHSWKARMYKQFLMKKFRENRFQRKNGQNRVDGHDVRCKKDAYRRMRMLQCVMDQCTIRGLEIPVQFASDIPSEEASQDDDITDPKEAERSSSVEASEQESTTEEDRSSDVGQMKPDPCLSAHFRRQYGRWRGFEVQKARTKGCKGERGQFSRVFDQKTTPWGYQEGCRQARGENLCQLNVGSQTAPRCHPAPKECARDLLPHAWNPVTGHLSRQIPARRLRRIIHTGNTPDFEDL